jgi:hypothetical protein
LRRSSDGWKIIAPAGTTFGVTALAIFFSSAARRSACDAAFFNASSALPVTD